MHWIGVANGIFCCGVTTKDMLLIVEDKETLP